MEKVDLKILIEIGARVGDEQQYAEGLEKDIRSVLSQRASYDGAVSIQIFKHTETEIKMLVST